MVSSLNRNLIFPDKMLSWLKPKVYRFDTDPRSASPSFSEHSLDASVALAQVDPEMNPKADSTFCRAGRTGPITDQSSMNDGDLNPLHSLSNAGYNVSTCKSEVSSQCDSDLSDSGTEISGRYSLASPVRPDDWLVLTDDNKIIKLIKTALKSNGSRQKRLARLAFGFRKEFQKEGLKVKLPYRLLKEILGSSLSIVKRATAISYRTEDFIRNLKEMKDSVNCVGVL